MVYGMFHRAGVAIALIAAILAPYGRCQSPDRAKAHECCMHHSAPAPALKANCCTIRSELPAVPVEHDAVNSVTTDVTNAFVAAPSVSSTPASAEATAPAGHWSPPGKPVLRI